MAAAPGDAREAPAHEQAPLRNTDLSPDQGHQDRDQLRIPVSSSFELRCADGRGCMEVTARLDAAHVARYVDHDDEQADRLFAAAERWAEVHQHGAPVHDANHRDGAA